MTWCALSRALCALAPGAIVTRRVERDWHSATFAGKRVMLDLMWAAAATDVEALAAMLGEHEFASPDLLVADILVTRQTCAADGTTALSIEALLLDDEV
jgi:hypothetical protein